MASTQLTHQHFRGITRSAPASDEPPITYPRPCELFSSTVLTEPGALRESIMKALNRLAALTKSEPDCGLLMAYADALEDLSPRALELAFVELERTWKIPALPAPGEIRECADTALQRERRRERAEREHATREELKQAAAAGQTMTFAEFVRKLRDDRPDLICLAERINTEERPPRINAMISTRGDDRRDRRRPEDSQGVEFFLQLERCARAEGWQWWPAYVERTRNRVR